MTAARESLLDVIQNPSSAVDEVNKRARAYLALVVGLLKGALPPQGQCNGSLDSHHELTICVHLSACMAANSTERVCVCDDRHCCHCCHCHDGWCTEGCIGKPGQCPNTR